MKEAIKNFPKQFEYEPKIESARKLKQKFEVRFATAVEELEFDPEQFEYKPEIENSTKLIRLKRFIVVGMGGSHLAADLLKLWRPDLPLVIHRDYGLPVMLKEDLAGSLIIASSYSGNTEEVLDAYDTAIQKGLAVVAMATGGILLERAQEEGVPFVRLPDTGIQPRSALGFAFKGLLKLMGEEEALRETRELAESLDAADDLEEKGKGLAARISGKIPIIYSSRRNQPIVYNWKIKFNETGKIPAFYNVFPELNHNEMTGFDVKKSTKMLSKKFYFIFLHDEDDHPQIQKRMGITKKLYEDRGFVVEDIFLESHNALKKIFSSLLLADWTAYYTAEQYGLEAEEVPMVEEFKKMIAG